MLKKYSFVYRLLLMVFSTSLYANEKKESFFWKIPSYGASVPAYLNKLKGSQWLGILGFSGITGYLSYRMFTYFFPKDCSEMSEVSANMTSKDLVLLELLISCAARDLAHIRKREKQAFEVAKVKLDGMTPYYAAEAEYMRNEFLQMAALCRQNDSFEPLLTSWFLQWEHAVEQACSRARSFFIQQTQTTDKERDCIKKN